MSLFHCPRCRKVLSDREVISIEQGDFCPKCRGVLRAWSGEHADVSSSDRLKAYDQAVDGLSVPSAERRVIGTFAGEPVDRVMLECEDALRFNPNNVDALFTLSK